MRISIETATARAELAPDVAIPLAAISRFQKLRARLWLTVAANGQRRPSQAARNSLNGGLRAPTDEQLKAVAAASGMTADAYPKLLFPMSANGASAKLSLMELDSLLSEYLFGGSMFLLDFSRVDIYEEHDCCSTRRFGINARENVAAGITGSGVRETREERPEAAHGK